MKKEQIEYLIGETPKLLQLIVWAEKASIVDILKSRHASILLELRRKAKTRSINKTFCDIDIKTPVTQTGVTIKSIFKGEIVFNLNFQGIYKDLIEGDLICFKTDRFIDSESNKVYQIKPNSKESFVYFRVIDKFNLRASYVIPSNLTVIEQYALSKFDVSYKLKTLIDTQSILPFLLIGDTGNILI